MRWRRDRRGVAWYDGIARLEGRALLIYDKRGVLRRAAYLDGASIELAADDETTLRAAPAFGAPVSLQVPDRADWAAALHAAASRPPEPPEGSGEVSDAARRRYAFFRDERRFVDDLVEVAEGLRRLPRDARQDALPTALSRVRPPALARAARAADRCFRGDVSRRLAATPRPATRGCFRRVVATPRLATRRCLRRMTPRPATQRRLRRVDAGPQVSPVMQLDGRVAERSRRGRRRGHGLQHEGALPLPRLCGAGAGGGPGTRGRRGADPRARPVAGAVTNAFEMHLFSCAAWSPGAVADAAASRR